MSPKTRSFAPSQVNEMIGNYWTSFGIARMATSGDITPYHVISDRHVNVASTEKTMIGAISMLDSATPDGCGGVVLVVLNKPEGQGGWMAFFGNPFNGLDINV
jgi:hypothetical protein